MSRRNKKPLKPKPTKRAAHGRFAKGTAPGPGRPKGSLSIWRTTFRESIDARIIEDAIAQLRKAIKGGQRWAVELLISYIAGPPVSIDMLLAVDELMKQPDGLRKFAEGASLGQNRGDENSESLL